MSSFSSLVRCSLLIILLVDEALMFKQHVRSGEPPTAFAQQAYGAPVTDMRSYIGIGCVGMDFDVMLPIEIVALGFYNPSANITPPQIQVAVFDRLTEETVPGADVIFTTTAWANVPARFVLLSNASRHRCAACWKILDRCGWLRQRLSSA